MKVNVLLSAYNGEAYIRTQIESLLTQSREATICIRDDGSTDATAAILREYENDPRFRITYGDNLGFIRSFFTLLRENGDADAFAFCDQDDEWLPDKLERGVRALSVAPQEVPTLYFSNCDYYDAALRFTGHHAMPQNLGFANALVDCPTYGFCTMINRALREEIVSHEPGSACGHDWWAYLTASALGRVIADDTVTVRYRRHGENVSAAGAGFLRFQLWRFRKFFLGGYFANITAQLCEFETLYADRLTEEERETLALFTRKTPGTALRKLFSTGKWRQGLTDEVLLRLCFLLGRL